MADSSFPRPRPDPEEEQRRHELMMRAADEVMSQYSEALRRLADL
jgi:hypothetical protein